MRPTILPALLLTATALPAFAQGDIDNGEKAFRKCQACHVVRDDNGDVLAGRNARTGPNLYGVIGRVAGTEPDFRNYSAPMREAGEAGLIWTKKDFVAFLQDPTVFLQTYLDDNKARSKMAFKTRSEDEARDLFAFIESFAPTQAN
ncbi:c-type cytochrome [Qingshengfaniella alkalisoli]|uniref:C-type cytochrome n=1 Tax=Qingshengfaniella alkalisoli TaxID=2599296 RepID=A0A5B8J6J2_9RHOB|nr:c-type cytochrome [Qingshengfaniella alkalisoli]QDY70057.1 c-type cytochrome [Qingshengfaniella alkalisoli]